MIFDPGPHLLELAQLAQWRRKGRVPKGERRIAAFYRVHKPDVNDRREFIVLPRGLLPKVRERFSLDVADRRLVLPALDFSWRGSLWEEQKAALRPLVRAESGVLVGMPGSGKTTAGLALVAIFRQPTLWVVNSKDLAAQALSRAQALFNLPPRAFGLIGAGSARVGSHFTVALVQTLIHLSASRLEILAKQFGCILVDEVHMTPAQQISKVVSCFPARYRFGLTATPYRSDGLDEAIFALFGFATGTIERRQLLRQGRIVLPSVVGVPTDFAYYGEWDWNKVQSARANDRRRNHLICSLVAREFRRGRHILVLVERKAHAKLLAAYLQERYQTPAFAVTGPVPPGVRRRAYDLLERGKLVIVATRLADQGLDLPSLDCLVLAAAARGDALSDDKAPTPRLEQQVGRIMRASEGKEAPVVYDLWDVGVDSLRNQIAERLAIYQKLGLRVEQQRLSGLIA